MEQERCRSKVASRQGLSGQQYPLQFLERCLQSGWCEPCFQVHQWPPRPPAYHDQVSMDVKPGRISDRQWSPRNARADRGHFGWQTFEEGYGGQVRLAGQHRAGRRDSLLQHKCGAGDARANMRDVLPQRECRVGDRRAWQHGEAQHGDRAGMRGALCHPDKRAQGDWSDRHGERTLRDCPPREGAADEERTVKLEKQGEKLKEQFEKQVRKFQAPVWSSLSSKEEVRA